MKDVAGSWDEIEKLTKRKLLSLVQTYSNYVMEFSEEHGEDGCYPICLPEFFDNEWQEMTTCLECGKRFNQERDIELCDGCVRKFDLNRLWKMHDEQKLDALDFNESKRLRERFRLKERML